MATFSPVLKGYVADVPKVVFRRCDGFAAAFDELTAATVTANIQTNDINAGWSLFPVATLPGQSTFTMSFTSAKFDAGLFSMANKVEYAANANYEMEASERYEPNTDHEIELAQTPVADSIFIHGMEETDEQTVATGKYKVDGKKITFSADDDIDYVDVIYRYVNEVQEAIITNKESAIGECTCIWPVYGSGDDCTESSIVGNYIVRVFRARITQVPGMDTSLAVLRDAA
jgi:hypothetical protein